VVWVWALLDAMVVLSPWPPFPWGSSLTIRGALTYKKSITPAQARTQEMRAGASSFFRNYRAAVAAVATFASAAFNGLLQSPVAAHRAMARARMRARRRSG
jgi:hypothetical protein